jgi:outer membrane protein OmpA-like peptidoglycan-associated protein
MAVRSLALLACTVSAALAGCATPSLLLLPNDDGAATGAVAVLDDKGGETVVDRPLTQTRLTRGRPATRDVKKVDPAQRRLIDGLPPRSVIFTLYFDEGTTRMTPQSRPVIESIRAEVAGRPGAEVQVTGHTDTVDTDEVNDRLSERRAQEIVEVLIGLGFSPDLLTAVGRGERAPFVATPDNTPNQQNRRVEVVVR